MPTIAVFMGIVISMYWKDHLPPHFHARYGEADAKFDIDTLEMFEGTLPQTQRRKAEHWARKHQDTLKAYWEMARHKQHLPRIQ